MILALTTAGCGKGSNRGPPLTLHCVVVHFHHILNEQKREVLQTWAHELDLKGMPSNPPPPPTHLDAISY